MPLYEYQDSCGTFEALRPLGERDRATCPTCLGDAPRLLSSRFAFAGGQVQLGGSNLAESRVPLADRPGRPKFIDRAAGGKGYRVEETGGYRPAVTHTAKCPKCNRRRNVAVLGKFPYGVRLNCEACSYQWIHQAATADSPLLEGVNSRYRPGKTWAGGQPSSYQHAEAGTNERGR